MNKLLYAFPSLIILAVMSYNVEAVTVYGETEMIAVNPGACCSNYVDWVYTDGTPLLAADSSFTFCSCAGGAMEYTNSAWYYYYQVENFNGDISTRIQAFQINVDPAAVITVGFISGADLDSGPFNHNIMGDHESALFTTLQAPLQARYESGTMCPCATFDFDAPSHLLDHEESVVLFISGKSDPDFFFSSMQNGNTWIGDVPGPGTPTSVPEPFSAILVAIGSIGLGLRSKKK